MTSKYHLDGEKYVLERFREGLATRVMIPSRVLLKEKLNERFKLIEGAGVKSLADLLKELKSKGKIEEFSKKSGVDADYLTVLRREAASFFPNPVSLKRFVGVDEEAVSKLGSVGIKNSKQLFDKTTTSKSIKELVVGSGVSNAQIKTFIGLSDLSRLYGVGPVFARILFDIGVDSVKKFKSKSAQKIVKIYEDVTGKKADFSASDIQFALDVAKDL